jgi:Cro/C1-type HTH DNA-binding domain
VTRTPERLNVAVLAALCDILDCQAGDLIETVSQAKPATKRGQSPTPPTQLRPRRARVLPAPTQ